MSFVSRLRFAAPLLFCPFALAAQSQPGVTFDQNIRSVRSREGNSDTTGGVVHVIATAKTIKLDFSGNVAGMPSSRGGQNAAIILSDEGAKMTLLSAEEKHYLSVNPAQMIEGAQKMMSGMGATVVFDTAASKVVVDSLGPGPAIGGHSTLHYRITSRFRVTLAMMGNNTVLDQQATEDLYTAPDYADLKTIGAGMDKFSSLSASMPFAKDFIDRMLAARTSLRGFPLRVVKQETQNIEGRTIASTSTVEITNIKRVSVPDSAFAIPADYTPISAPGMPQVDTTSRQ